jgi:hypothetical protein
METFVIHPDKQQGKALRAILKALNVPFEITTHDEVLPEHVIKGIKRGQDDVKAGRSITLNEFKQRLSTQ